MYLSKTAQKSVRLRERQLPRIHNPLRDGKEVRLASATIAQLYAIGIAGRWVMPRAFRSGGDGRKRWESKQRPEEEYTKDVARVYARLHHPAIPRWMSERLYTTATGTEFVGPRFYQGKRGECRRCGHEETCEHKYCGCETAQRAWRIMLDGWERMTGEVLSPNNEWVTMWGARWGDKRKGSDVRELQRRRAADAQRAKDEKAAADAGAAVPELRDMDAEEEGQPGEEAFRAIHAAMVVALHEGATRVRPWGAGRIMQRARALVTAMVRDTRRDRPAAFERHWVGYGLARAVGAAEVCIMWQRSDRGRDSGTKIRTEVYTDGSAIGQQAGWGYVVVREGSEVASGSGPVVTGARTNNVAEVRAVGEALRWAAEHSTHVRIRYDSKYAATVIRSMRKPRRNAVVVTEARHTLAVALSRGLKVEWEHVKGHSGHVWNDRADALADTGREATCDAMAAQEESGQSGATTERNGPGAVDVGHAPACRHAMVRWVRYKPTEADRIMKARTRHGCINAVAHGRAIQTATVREKVARAVRRVRSEMRRGEIASGHGECALARVQKAGKELQDSKLRDAERRARKRQVYTRILRCKVNVSGLRSVLEELELREMLKQARAGLRGAVPQPGEVGAEAGTSPDEDDRAEGASVGSSVLRQVMQLAASLGGARPAGACANVYLAYSFSRRGRDLFEAGHVTGSREYAAGIDPFKWPAWMRDAAIAGTGWVCDDVAAYPRARMAMVSTGREVCARFLRHREEIMRQAGAHLFGDGVAEAERRKRMKGVTNGFDMDSGLNAWVTKYGNPRGVTLAGYAVDLGDGLKRFSLAEYRTAQQEGTRCIAGRSEAMLEMLREGFRAGSREWKRRELTAKSYVLQEAEAAAREAKMQWAEEAGLEVQGLQHDGIVVGGSGVNAAEMELGMSRAATQWCGYSVDVKVVEAE